MIFTQILKEYMSEMQVFMVRVFCILHHTEAVKWLMFFHAIGSNFTWISDFLR